jgi:hypothetical protein
LAERLAIADNRLGGCLRAMSEGVYCGVMGGETRR